MSIGHKDPALHTARQLLAGVCECGETEGEHTGHRATMDAPPDGPCGATGCSCRRFKCADLVVSRLKTKPLRRRLAMSQAQGI
jgi:hypothetical protein